jgi:hypothetical protein
MWITKRAMQGIVALAIVGVALMACSFGGSNSVSSSGSSGSGSSSSTTRSGSSSTTTSGGSTTTASVTRCSQLAAFASAGTASLTAHFYPAIGVPAGSVGYIASKYETNGFQYRVINYCTPGQTIAGIRSAMSATFPASGYHQTPFFPLRGDPHASCGDPYCWSWGDAGPQYYAGLEVLSGEGNIGSVATYDIRLIIPPLSSGSVRIHAGDSFSLFTGTVLPSASGADFTLADIIHLFADGSDRIAAPIPGTDLNSVSYHQLAVLSYSGNFVNFSLPSGDNTTHIIPITEGSGTYVKVYFAPVSGDPTALQVHWVMYGTTF